MAKNLNNILMEILFSSSSSESSDDDLDLYLLKGYKYEIPVIKDFILDVVHLFSDEEFRRNFRMSRYTAYELVRDYEKSNFYPKKNNALSQVVSAENHVLSFLWFAGNKCCLRDVAQRFGIGVSTLFRQIIRFNDFLIAIAPDKIKFPKTTEQKEYSAHEFSKISNFPNIIGCIDGTYINIRTPAHKVKSTYTNRHDMPAMTLQGICNHKRQFIDVFTGTPAKLHDSRVLKLSHIAKELPEICGSKYHLLGDSAYAIREWLLTPYKDYGNLTESQKRFNYRLSSSRVLIENTFGILKSRFRQLLHLSLHKVPKITNFIIGCCVLHNMCIENNDHIEADEHDSPTLSNNETVISDAQDMILRQRGETKRDVIKNNFQYTD